MFKQCNDSCPTKTRRCNCSVPRGKCSVPLIQFKSVTAFPTPKDMFSICSNCLHFWRQFMDCLFCFLFSRESCYLGLCFLHFSSFLLPLWTLHLAPIFLEVLWPKLDITLLLLPYRRWVELKSPSGKAEWLTKYFNLCQLPAVSIGHSNSQDSLRCKRVLVMFSPSPPLLATHLPL